MTASIMTRRYWRWPRSMFFAFVLDFCAVARIFNGDHVYGAGQRVVLIFGQANKWAAARLLDLECGSVVSDRRSHDPSRKLIRQVLGAVNEYERAMIVSVPKTWPRS
jgi:hypothetical protein